MLKCSGLFIGKSAQQPLGPWERPLTLSAPVVLYHSPMLWPQLPKNWECAEKHLLCFACVAYANLHMQTSHSAPWPTSMAAQDSNTHNTPTLPQSYAHSHHRFYNFYLFSITILSSPQFKRVFFPLCCEVYIMFCLVRDITRPIYCIRPVLFFYFSLIFDFFACLCSCLKWPKPVLDLFSTWFGFVFNKSSPEFASASMFLFPDS